MTITDQLIHLDTTKALIRETIQEMGVEVPEDTPFRDYAMRIGEISKGFEPGTRMLFQQSFAPAGWTRVIDPALDDSALRLVTSSEVTGGGVNGFVSRMASGVPISGTVGATTLTVAQMPSHQHMSGAPTDFQFFGLAYPGWNAPKWLNSTAGNMGATPLTNSVGGSGSHTHSLSINALNLNVKYVDLIVCSKD